MNFVDLSNIDYEKLSVYENCNKTNDLKNMNGLQSLFLYNNLLTIFILFILSVLYLLSYFCCKKRKYYKKF